MRTEIARLTDLRVDIEGWLDNLVDGIVTSGPEETEIGGMPAIYFEA